MAIKTNPYLFFRGNCREAMEFYKDIFGGELTIMTNGESGVPEDIAPKDYIMHASLSGGLIELMASDTSGASEKAAKVTISLSGDDEEKLKEVFQKLSADITPQFPLKKESWGDIFGSLQDKYGVDWMVNISQPKEN